MDFQSSPFYNDNGVVGGCARTVWFQLKGNLNSKSGWNVLLPTQLRPSAKHLSLDGGGDGLSLVEQTQSGGKLTERGVVVWMKFRRVGLVADANDIRLILRARVHRPALGANANLYAIFADAQFDVTLSGVITKDPESLFRDVVHRVFVVRCKDDVAQRQPTLCGGILRRFSALTPGKEKIFPHVDPLGEFRDGNRSERTRERTRCASLLIGGATLVGNHGFTREFFRATLRCALAFTRANDDDRCTTTTMARGRRCERRCRHTG